MPSEAAISIGFIGFGEVGQTFSRGLLKNASVTVAAWDILFPAPGGEPLLIAAQNIGVKAMSSAAAAIEGTDVVISAVTADQAEAVAAECAALLQPGQIFFDINSAAPSTKRRAAEAVQTSGAHYVEGAVMAAVRQPGLRVPILTGGPHAAAAAGLLNGLGMNLTAVATEHGRASAIKLCRSVIIKGLEVLMVNCDAASEGWGVKHEVFASLSETFPSIDWVGLAANMRERVETHGIRRAAEMREAAEMLAALGLDAPLALAVADAQQRHAKPKP